MLIQKSWLSFSVVLIATAFCSMPIQSPQDDVEKKSSEVVEQKSNRSAARMSEGTKRDQATRHKLKKIVSLEFDETELVEVIEELKISLGTEIHLDQSAKDDMLTLDQPITFSMKGLPINVALREMMREHNATYVVQNGLIKIISLDAADDTDFFTRRYIDVGEVLDELKRREPNRVGKHILRKWGSSAPGGVFNQVGAGLGGRGQPHKTSSRLMAPPQGEEVKVIAEEVEVLPEDFLVETIKSTIHTDRWDDTGGDGTLHILGGVLVIYTTERAAAEIEDLLQNLQHNWSK